MDDKEALPSLRPPGLNTHNRSNIKIPYNVWKGGDFVIWDNRGLMHKANGDYDMKRRTLLYRFDAKGCPAG